MTQRYIPCEKLFPNWPGARRHLTYWVHNIRGFVVTTSDNHQKLTVQLDQGTTLIANDNASDIVQRTLAYFLPDISMFKGAPNNEHTRATILDHINRHCREIEAREGLTLKDKLRVNLGLLQ